MRCKESLTGQYLSGAKKIYIPDERRQGNGNSIIVKGAREHNLKNIDVEFPLGKFVCVTGVSGSGKSSLVNEILYKGAARVTNRLQEEPGEYDTILGLEHIDKVIDIDQSPIGRTPRSNPATYTGMFNHIRDLFASLPEAKLRGYEKGRFSFNVKGGRCEACGGATASFRSRCISCRMCMCLVRSARANDTTARRWKSNIKEKVSSMYLT